MRICYHLSNSSLFGFNVIVLHSLSSLGFCPMETGPKQVLDVSGNQEHGIREQVQNQSPLCIDRDSALLVNPDPLPQHRFSKACVEWGALF